MNQKMFNNIVLVIIVLIFLKQITPRKDSTLYILSKYSNYIIDKIKQILDVLGLYNYVDNFMNTSFYGRTFPGIPNLNSKTPIMNDNYAKYFIKSFSKLNPNVPIQEIKNLYNFVDNLVAYDIDNFFLTPSDTKPYLFTLDEKNKIKSILLQNLNSGEFSFRNFAFLKQPVYYYNFSGKEVEPFIFTVDSDYGELKIYIEISIRNDVKKNSEYLSINKIKLLVDPKSDLYDKSNLFKNGNLMDDITINYDEKMFEDTNYINDFIVNDNRANNTDITDGHTEFNINYEINEYLPANYDNDYGKV
jgi:hypothetical protein